MQSSDICVINATNAIYVNYGGSSTQTYHYGRTTMNVQLNGYQQGYSPHKGHGRESGHGSSSNHANLSASKFGHLINHSWF